MPQKYPLQWPVGYPRTQSPSRSAFKNPTLGKVVEKIIAEITRLTKFHTTDADPIISSNVPLRNDGLPRADYMRSHISDKGVAVYFKKGDADVVLCCDKWDTVESNLHAIYLTIEALRAVDRWGVSDFLSRSFTGFKALPAAGATNKRDWWIVFFMDVRPPSVNGERPFWRAKIDADYRRLAKQYHPDKPGGDLQKFQELNAAYEEAKDYFRD